MRCAKGFIWVVNIHNIKPDPATPAAGGSPATGMGLPDRIDKINFIKMLFRHYQFSSLQAL